MAKEKAMLSIRTLGNSPNVQRNQTKTKRIWREITAMNDRGQHMEEPADIPEKDQRTNTI